MQSAEEVDYNQILPAVKVRPKRKKRSPSSTLNDEKNDSMLRVPGERHPSTSRISNAGNFKNPKLRDTLN